MKRTMYSGLPDSYDVKKQRWGAAVAKVIVRTEILTGGVSKFKAMHLKNNISSRGNCTSCKSFVLRSKNQKDSTVLAE